MSAIFREAAVLTGNLIKGYGPRPIPDPLDDQIGDIVEKWCNLSTVNREAESNALTYEQNLALLAYSERMASRAVRDRQSEDIFRGLIALGIDGWKSDWRASTMIISLHWHSAKKIDTNLQVILLRASGLLPSKVSEAFAAFLRRNPEDQEIAAMGYEEGSDDDGFRYHRNW